jgi:hypothetical protein
MHSLFGLLVAATGYGVRTTCQHRGLLPHPLAHISLTVLLVFAEAAAVVPILG